MKCPKCDDGVGKIYHMPTRGNDTYCLRCDRCGHKWYAHFVRGKKYIGEYHGIKVTECEKGYWWSEL